MTSPKTPIDFVKQLGDAAVNQIKKRRKHYDRLRNIAAILALIFAVTLGTIVGLTSPQNSSVASQASQSLIAVDGFLAAASGVIAFFYSGKLLEFASPSSPLMLASRPLIMASFEATVKKEFESRMQSFVDGIAQKEQLNQREIAQTQKKFIELLGQIAARLFEETEKIVRDMTQGARRMAYYAAFVLITLIVSAFFATLAILSGSVQSLGVGFGLTVLGSGFLALAWSDAHVNLTAFLVMIQASESLRTPRPTGTEAVRP